MPPWPMAHGPRQTVLTTYLEATIQRAHEENETRRQKDRETTAALAAYDNAVEVGPCGAAWTVRGHHGGMARLDLTPRT
jgi:hypothetical protein